MKSSRTVELSDASWRWLEAYAADRKMTVDEYLQYTLNYYLADSSTRALRQRVEQLEAALEASRKSRLGLPLRRRPLDPYTPPARYDRHPRKSG